VPARFVFTVQIGADVAGISGAGDGVTWRLVGANNREMGRSPQLFASLPACREAVGRLQASLREAQSVLSADPVTGHWGWRVEVGVVTVATGSRLYQRQRECKCSASQFLALAPTALVAPDVVSRPPVRGLRRPEFLVPRRAADDALLLPGGRANRVPQS